MNIRETGMRHKYEEAKAFIAEYESQLHGATKWPSKWYYIYQYRQHINGLQERMRKNGSDQFDPYMSIIEHRRNLIKEELKKIYKP